MYTCTQKTPVWFWVLTGGMIRCVQCFCTYQNFGTNTISDEETSANMQSHHWPFPHRSCR